jgi:hypothetical protein
MAAYSIASGQPLGTGSYVMTGTLFRVADLSVEPIDSQPTLYLMGHASPHYQVLICSST